MRSGAERLTEEREITIKTYTKNKIRTIGVNNRGTNDLYVIWLKMIDLQKRLGHQNLCHVAMKKINSFCKTKYPTKEHVKKYKRKMSQWINDDKSVYICEDLAYKIIRYIILGVIEADEFRKNLGVKNDQSV